MKSFDTANGGRFALAQARDHWYILCRSDELRDKPLARKIFNTPLVLFRGAERQIAVLLDRCAHRNVPLSVGSVVGTQLQCAYHGWRYDTDGVCRAVPTLCSNVEGKARRVASYAAREQQGFVWAYGTPDVVPGHEPFVIPHLDDKKYHAVRYAYRFQASLYSTIENILDVPHTAFLHGGLFRQSGGKKNKISVHVTRHGDRVQAEYVGEPVPKGFIGRVLAPGGGFVTHFDRFILPSIAQVEYGLGIKSHLVVTDMLTPVSDFETELNTVVTIRLPFATGLVSRLMAPAAVHVAKQDARMLQLQTQTVQRFGGEQFVNTDVDVLGPHILRLLRQAERGEVDMAAAVFEERVELEV